jgi:hypothetical protein
LKDSHPSVEKERCMHLLAALMATLLVVATSLAFLAG